MKVGEMAQWLWAFATLAEDLGLIPNTQLVVYNICNFSPSKANAHFFDLHSRHTNIKKALKFFVCMSVYDVLVHGGWGGGIHAILHVWRSGQFHSFLLPYIHGYWESNSRCRVWAARAFICWTILLADHIGPEITMWSREWPRTPDSCDSHSKYWDYRHSSACQDAWRNLWKISKILFGLKYKPQDFTV